MESSAPQRISDLEEHFYGKSGIDTTTKIESHAICTKIDLCSFGEYLKEDFEKRCKLKLFSKK
jgi:hypothetical protein